VGGGGDGEDVYNYDGGLNSNLLKQNKDLKEELDELNLKVELKDCSIEQMIGEMESLRKEIELKNSNIEENERRIGGLGLEVEDRNSGVVGLKNQLSCYEGLHHERKAEQLDLVGQIREMQNVEFEGINQGVEDVKFLVSGLAAAFTETNKVVQQKLKDLDEKINQKKKFSESQILKS
jgi:chromosome segregation ATPase